MTRKLFWTLGTLLLVNIAVDTTVVPVDRVDAYLNKAAKKGYSGSVLLAVKGKVLLKKGYGLADPEKQIPFQVDTAFDIESITKQFTAAAILKLESEKKLSINDPILVFLLRVSRSVRSLIGYNCLKVEGSITLYEEHAV